MSGEKPAGRTRRRTRQSTRVGPLTGARLELEVGPVAHGGHCVARHEGRVVFVRHALPGERVVAEVTEDRGGSYARADAVEVLTASPDRVAAPCRYAGPGRCGGCDWQHAEPAAQRTLKAAVVREQLIRLGGLDPATVDALGVEVAALPGESLGWRSRVAYAVGPDGRAGLRRHRSHEVVAVDRCPLVTDAVHATGVTAQKWPPGAVVEVAADPDRAAVVVTPPDGAPRRVAGPARLTERLSGPGEGRSYRVSATGFWQPHVAAAQAYVDAVLAGLEPRPGEHAVDLYGGSGLFTGALAAAVGTDGSVAMVEADPAACTDARRSLHDLPWARIVPGEVEAVLTAGGVGAVADSRADIVVLDPPRSGAGAAVVRAVAGLGPRAVAYVACDPAALARDVRTFGERGYRLEKLWAYDAFPMTHHVECVAILRP